MRPLSRILDRDRVDKYGDQVRMERERESEGREDGGMTPFRLSTKVSIEAASRCEVKRSTGEGETGGGAGWAIASRERERESCD